MEGNIIVKKAANFLVDHVALKLDTAIILADLAGAKLSHATLVNALDSAKRKHGGTWVGGSVVVTDKTLSLSANALNRSLQEGNLDLNVPLSSIESITVTGWFLGKTATVVATAGTIKFRCFGIDDVAEKVRMLATNSS